MTQAIQTSTTRRQFSKLLAGLAGAATATVSATAFASPDDDSALLRLAARAVEAGRAGNANNQEIHQRGLDEYWRDEFNRLRYLEPTDGRMLTEQEAWDRVAETPRGKECLRLEDLRDGHWDRAAKLLEQLLAIPAHTEGGREAKVAALLCVLGAEWQDRDQEVGWDILMVRGLLIDLVGGDAAASLRDQFA